MKIKKYKCDSCGAETEDCNQEGWLRVGHLEMGMGFTNNSVGIVRQDIKKFGDFCNFQCLQNYLQKLKR